MSSLLCLFSGVSSVLLRFSLSRLMAKPSSVDMILRGSTSSARLLIAISPLRGYDFMRVTSLPYFYSAVHFEWKEHVLLDVAIAIIRVVAGC